jgi:predicted flap endonuclease-1-like 5' DNA nuclease
MALGKGVGVWISGFLTFLAGLNTLNAIMLWTYQGADAIIEPYLVGSVLGEIQVKEYFWLSLATTLIFLGLASIIAYSGPTPYQVLLKMIARVEEKLAANRKKLEATRRELFAKLEYDRMACEELFNSVNTSIDNAKKEMLSLMERQRKAVEKAREEMLSILEEQAKAIQKDVFSVVNTSLGSTRKEMLSMLEKQRKAIQRAMQKVMRLSRQGAVAAEKQRVELADLRERLERLERELTPPQPRLTSRSSPEEIKGIGPRFGEELRSMGITNVGELVTADPALIAERTRLTPEMALRLQARAQLLMVPGIDESDAELLEEAGIVSRRELASQDPVLLSRRIGEVLKANAPGVSSEGGKPTIEEVSSWIRLAKS